MSEPRTSLTPPSHFRSFIPGLSSRVPWPTVIAFFAKCREEDADE